MPSENKVAIVTGSATGIGAAAAIQLAEKGWNVVVNYSRSEADAKNTEAECRGHGVETLLHRADVADDAACRAMVEATMAKWGRVDALVNNAGATKYVDHNDLEGLTPEDFQHIYAVNVIGVYQMVRAVTSHMKSAGTGSIVNVSSISGVSGIGSSIAYAASKGAVNTMTLSLARVLAPEIRINTICPGFVGTRWQRDGQGDKYDAVVQSVEASTPLRHACTAEDIAETVIMMVEGGRYMTGEVLLVDAGHHLDFTPLVAR